MKHLLKLLIAMMAIAPVSTWAQEATLEPSDSAGDTQVAPPSEPPAAPPAQPAPEQVPAPPASAEQTDAQPAAPPPGVPSGQWAYTGQYGWVWMPYAQNYTYVPDSGDPYMYVYYPSYGWTWVTAPWIFGWGPSPYWGAWGVHHFAWYSRPWFRGGRIDRGYHGYGGWAGGHPQARVYAGNSVGIHSGGAHFGGAVHPSAPVGHPGGGWGGHGGSGGGGGGHSGGGGHGGGHR